MTTVFLKVISGILRQHEELLRKYKQKALKLKEYDGIFLNARTTGGRTYFTGHRSGKNILTTFEDGGTIDTEKIDKMILREFFTSPTVQEKTTGVNPEEFLKQQMQAQTTTRFAG